VEGFRSLRHLSGSHWSVLAASVFACSQPSRFTSLRWFGNRSHPQVGWGGIRMMKVSIRLELRWEVVAKPALASEELGTT